MTAPRDTEATLRRALAHRADAVEPDVIDFAAVEARATAVRAVATRRHTVLGVAAALLLIVGLVGVLTVGDGDDERTDVATDAADPATASTGTTGAPAPGGPSGPSADPRGLPSSTIWPLPTMSILYTDPADAALAYASGYLGFTGPLCTRSLTQDQHGSIIEVIHDGVCSGGLTGASEPFGPSMTLFVLPGDHGWEVFGSESTTFLTQFEVTTTATRLAGRLHISVPNGLAPTTMTVEVRPLGELQPIHVQAVDPLPGDGMPVTVGIDVEIDGPVVLIVSDGVTATASVRTPPNR